MRSLRRRPATERVHCVRCGAPYRPALTHGDCPVCGLVGDPRFHPDEDDVEQRPVTLALAAMALNLVVFGLVVWAVLG